MWSRIVLLLVASVFCVTPAQNSAIPKDLQRKILWEHNKLRRTLRATNMRKMMALAKVPLVGCGYDFCSSGRIFIFVCRYLPQRITNQGLYIIGSKGSACGRLSRRKGLCDCGKKYCANNGEMNLRTCQCECSAGWSGPECIQSARGGHGGGGGRKTPVPNVTPVPIKNGVSEANKEKIVDLHNELRSTLGGTNLQKIYWNNELAEMAQKWANGCKLSKHNKKGWHKGYNQQPGENMGWRAGYEKDPWINMEKIIMGWWKEKDDFTYGYGSSEAFLHYTQMAIARVSLVGCGYSQCTDRKWTRHFLVCNYLDNNGPSKRYLYPYKRGSKGSACGSKYLKNGLCDCEGKYCANTGEMNLQTCKCKCHKKWSGSECTTPRCNMGKEWGCTSDLCDYYNTRPNCPRTCGSCKG